MTMVVWENSFFAISAVSNLLGAEWIHIEPTKTSFLIFFYHMQTVKLNSRPKFSLFVSIVFQIF